MNDHAGDRLDFSYRMRRLAAEFSAKVGDYWSAVGPVSRLDAEDDNPFSIGGRRSFVPALGETEWEAPEALAARAPFRARIYRLRDGRPIGYIRVPHYTYDEDAVDVFATLIAHFEDATEALVLDQVNNPGGSMFHMYSILSYLTDRALALPQHQLALDDDDAAIAADNVALAEGGDPEERPTPELVAYSRFVLSEIEAGRKRLTNPVHLFGVKEILPAANPYSKNIVVLINPLTFSASEFLAAILQDNGRAVLFGERTAGAGGCFKRRSIPNQLGVESFTVTWTIAWRANGQPIENVGVHPDVEYLLTVEDLQKGYGGYREALLGALGVSGGSQV